MEEDIFRKEAWDNVTSPEHLDRLLQITNPAAWISLIALGLVILTSVAWGIWGTISYEVNGSGIIIKQGGINNVVALGSGQITELSVKNGDSIKVGQLIAKVSNPQLYQQYVNTKQSYDEMKMYNALLKNIDDVGLNLDLNNLKNQIRSSEFSLDVLKEQLEAQKKIIEEQRILLSKELIVDQDLLSSVNEMNTIKNNIIQTENQLKQYRANEIEMKNTNTQTTLQNEQNFKDTERQLKLLETQLNLSSNIISSFNGKVIETLVDESSIVDNGTQVLRIETLLGENEAILYVPSSSQGKNIQPGMIVDITPANVEEENYGFMIGKVNSISEYPSTGDGMMLVLDNDQLVNSLMQGGAPYAVTVGLIKDSTTFSGYKWSSSKGPPVKIGVGTLCTGGIVTQQVAPISLVLPLLKKYLE